MNDDIYCIGLTRETCYQALPEIRDFIEYQNRKGLGSIALMRIYHQIKNALENKEQTYQ
mgnify:FL=1